MGEIHGGLFGLAEILGGLFGLAEMHGGLFGLAEIHGGLFFAGMTMSMTMAWQPLSGNDNEYDNGMAASLREWQWRPFFGYDNGGLSLDMITVAPLWITILQRWYGSAGHVWLDPHLLW